MGKNNKKKEIKVENLPMKKIEGFLQEQTYGIPWYVAEKPDVEADEYNIDTNLIQENMAYVLTGNGLYIYRDMGIIKSLTKTRGVIGLGDAPEKVMVNIHYMPSELVYQTIEFFRWANKHHSAEAIVLPYYNPETKEHLIVVPKQTVSIMSVDEYVNPSNDEIPEGFVKIGTIHSHGDSSAYHSAVDDHDEENDFDGIHLTFGKIHNSVRGVEVASSVVVDGVRWNLAPNILFGDDIITKTVVKGSLRVVGRTKTYEPEHIEYRIKPAEEKVDFPDEWKDKVTFNNKTSLLQRAAGYRGTGYTGYGTYNTSSYTSITNKPTCYNCMFSWSSYAVRTATLLLETIFAAEDSKVIEKIRSETKSIKKTTVNISELPTELEEITKYINSKYTIKEAKEIVEQLIPNRNYDDLVTSGKFGKEAILLVIMGVRFNKFRKNLISLSNDIPRMLTKYKTRYNGVNSIRLCTHPSGPPEGDSGMSFDDSKRLKNEKFTAKCNNFVFTNYGMLTEPYTKDELKRRKKEFNKVMDLYKKNKSKEKGGAGKAIEKKHDLESMCIDCVVYWGETPPDSNCLCFGDPNFEEEDGWYKSAEICPGFEEISEEQWEAVGKRHCRGDSADDGDIVEIS